MGTQVCVCGGDSDVAHICGGSEDTNVGGGCDGDTHVRRVAVMGTEMCKGGVNGDTSF